MKYLARLGWGIVIYAVVYLAWNTFSVYGFTSGLLPRICLLLALVTMTTIAGRAIALNSWKDILPYSFFWAVTALALDAVVTLPLASTQMYSNWQLWAGYAMVCILPLAAPLTRVYRDDTGHLA